LRTKRALKVATRNGRPEKEVMTTIDWVRTLRAIVVTVLLVAALLAAVLGLIGATGPASMWAHTTGERSAMPQGADALAGA
jgi:hypothetical protein